MAQEVFTSIDQIKRDMELGVFPKMSEQTRREMAEAARVFDVAMESLKAGAPGLSDVSKRSIARSIAMKLSRQQTGDPDMPDLTLCSFEYIAAEMRKRGATVTPAPHGGDFASR